MLVEVIDFLLPLTVDRASARRFATSSASAFFLASASAFMAAFLSPPGVAALSAFPFSFSSRAFCLAANLASYGTRGRWQFQK